ncbi:3-dehydroquinate synthase [Anaerohalosphaera lusitana]|uniref:3-dehydroquinate synthase n=1 Tax=Anaerohalosphaera lusitana TaxID=1936003 RepID=A0A1U9NIT2_9BACT|nr:3-dehydroquinate synthase [Anaerohalosphaera lusitana]AQT67697.1 3-dehydroquinate synthase [Anaerohalosphaera lusitana]
MTQIKVNIPAKPAQAYTITIGSGQLADLWPELTERYAGKSMFIVTDANLVKAGHLEKLTGTNEVQSCVIDPPGEKSKHIQTVVNIIEAMEKEFMGRDSVIVALGGGTVGDIAGFAAAIFKRGVDVVQIPTTTVAQADSSVGGKTGVDSTLSKNAFGAFWQPTEVCIDVETLKTLDDREYLAGLAESIKHGLIADADYFEFLEQHITELRAKDTATLEQIAERNCRIKAAVVEEDPTEKNKRRILNYGHTIGHAVESASNYELLHGECVGIGMVGAAMIEAKMGIGDKGRVAKIEYILTRLGLPVSIPAELDKDQLIDIIRRDKKAVAGWPKFVLLDQIGTALCKNNQWAHDVPPEIVEQTLTEMY